MSFISKFGISFSDKIDDNVNEAFSNAPQKTGRALKQRQSLLRLSRNLLGLDMTNQRGSTPQVNKEIFKREQPYFLFKWNVLHISELALFLGLRAYYSVGHILLRTTLEGEMKGVFFNSLAKERYRSKIDPKDLEVYGSKIDFHRLLQILNKKSDTIKEDSRLIFSIIEEANMEGIYKIMPKSLREVLHSLNLFFPYDKQNIKEIYAQLSPYVHMHPKKGLSAQSVETEGHPYGFPRHTQEQLSKFLDLYGEILDVTGVLMLNEFKEYMESSQIIRNILESKDYGLKSLQLTHSHERLTNLCAYSEALMKITKQIGEKPQKTVKNNRIVQLSLQKTNFSDPTPLSEFPYLQKLYLTGTDITDITPLKALEQLQVLKLSGTNITDITPLKNLTTLQKLYLSGTNITDITPLKNLTNLIHLDLRSTNVVNLSPLQNLEKLRSLDLENTKIKDITPLKALDNLKKIRIHKTIIEKDNTVLQQLQSRGTTVLM